MANIVKRPEVNIVKKKHRFTNCNAKELQMMFEEAGVITPKIIKAIGKVTSACTPCASSRRSSKSRKISHKNMSEEFNIEVEVGYMTVKLRDAKYEILYVVNTSMAYGERITVKYRNTKTMMTKFEEIWLLQTYNVGKAHRKKV